MLKILLGFILFVYVKISGTTDLLALHAFVEKVTVFLNATDPNSSLDEAVASIFGEYADKLSAQGSLVTASKYCRCVFWKLILYFLFPFFLT